MKSGKILITLGMVSTLAVLAPAKSSGSAGVGSDGNNAPSPAQAEAKKDVLTITGKGFAATVHQPEGWAGEVEAAKKYHGNLLFTPTAEDGKAGGAVILVSVEPKYDENVDLHLQRDIQSYRKQSPDIEIADLDVKHPTYATYPKSFSKAGDFYYYVAYVNPGNSFPHSFYVGLSKKKVPATPAELAAYRDVLESLRMIPQAEPKPK
ncbi:MAG TPA: hypothetical protein VGH73_13290 [Thermoanaerobaculia bacterium]|jgi:hypothetical protein